VTKRTLILSLLLLASFTAVNIKISHPVGAQAGHVYYFPFFAQYEGFREFSSIGPDGGTVTSIAIDPIDSQVIYAGTWGNGIYKSVDSGEKWTHQSVGFRAGFVFDLAIDPENHQHLLASAYRFGAYQSYDGGANWTKTSGMPEETVVYSFAFHPENPDIVYAAVRTKTIYNPSPHYPGGVYKSTDGGGHWIKRSQGLPDDYVYDIAIDPNNPNVLYTAMHETGVYKSVDSAGSWSSVNHNIHYRDVRSLAINPDNSTLYAGMYDGKGVAYSTNGGASWSTITSSLNQALYVYKLQLDPHDQVSLNLNTPDGLFRCMGNPYPSSQSICSRIAHDNRYVFALALDETSAAGAGKITKLYTGLQTYGLHKSTDAGQSFSASYSGLKSNVVLSVVNDPASPATLYASILGRGVFKSTDAGQTWRAIRDGMSSSNINHLVFRPDDSRVLYAATQDAGIYVTINGGESWSASNSGIAQSGDEAIGGDTPFNNTGFDHPSYSWMDPVDREALSVSPKEAKSLTLRNGFPEILTIQMNPDDPSKMFAGTAGRGVIKSNDYGQTWQSTELTWGEVYDSIADLRQPVFKFIIGVSEAGFRGSDLDRTAWPARNAGFQPEADVYGLAMGSTGKYYAASDQGIYTSSNGGGTWSLAGLGNIRFNDIFVDPGRLLEVWAASSDGLYRSLDGGIRWEQVGEANLNDQFLTIARGYGTNMIYFGMSGGNIYRVEQ
jgi:photosystem II stability/assembly factor-like uncharacterized protein